jgi:hypothetical protein
MAAMMAGQKVVQRVDSLVLMKVVWWVSTMAVQMVDWKAEK